MMEILNSMGGSRATKPQHSDRPMIKVVPTRGVVGERGGIQARSRIKTQSSVESMSLPQLSNSQRHRHRSDASAPLTSRSDHKQTTRRPGKPLNKNKSVGSMSFRSQSPDQRALDKQLLDSMMSSSQNDVSRLAAAQEEEEDDDVRTPHAWAKTAGTTRLFDDRLATESVTSYDKTQSEPTPRRVPFDKTKTHHSSQHSADEAMPSIADMTSQRNIRVGEESGGGGTERMKYIDLFHQLILWKKTGFLLDNISFTQDMCEGLVEAGLFNSDMMSDIMVRLSTDIVYSVRMK